MSTPYHQSVKVRLRSLRLFIESMQIAGRKEGLYTLSNGESPDKHEFPHCIAELRADGFVVYPLYRSNGDFYALKISWAENGKRYSEIAKHNKPKRHDKAKSPFGLLADEQEAQKVEVQFDTTHKCEVHCDGSTLNNGGKDSVSGAAAVVIDRFLQFKIVGKFLGKSTCNRAEMEAAIIGLNALEHPSAVTVFSDSQYLIKTMNKAYRRKMNLDLWNQVDAAAARHRVTWNWVKGHAGNPYNEAADKGAGIIAASGFVPMDKLNEILESIM